MKRQTLSRKRRIKQGRQVLGPEWRELKEYGRLVMSIAKHCRCHWIYCPCDSVLAGGVCDEREAEHDVEEDVDA